MFDHLARFTGILLGGILGWVAAFWVPGVPQNWLNPAFLRWGVPFALAGAVIGYVSMPYLVTRPTAAAANWIRTLPLHHLLAGSVGLALGLIIAAVLAVPLSHLPSPLGQVLPLIGTLVFGYLGTAIFVLRYEDIWDLWRQRSGRRAPRKGREREMPVLLDTSVIIDGRIADIARTGFIPGPLLVPRFVLNELQYIADSTDQLRRNRGRRGLSLLHELQDDTRCELRIIEDDVPRVKEVDEKLVRLARKMDIPIVTNDYNLNRVATLQGVDVLNINELANAVKTVLLPGESLDIQLIQEGKEAGQGVGYLEDGTMVVVQDGRPYVGRRVHVTVTKVLQTNAGRMIFAIPSNHHLHVRT